MYTPGRPLLTTTLLFRWCSFVVFKATLLACVIYFAVVLRIRYRGRSHLKRRRGCLLISNHVLALDPAVIAATLGWRSNAFFTELEETARIPFLGTYTRLLGAAPLPKENAIRRIEREIFAKAYRYKQFVHCFPEGECYLRNQNIKPFQIGFFYIAARLRIPVIPIVFILHRQQWLGKSQIRLFKREIKVPPRVTVQVLKPVEPPVLKTAPQQTLHHWATSVHSQMQRVIDSAGGDKSLAQGKIPRLSPEDGLYRWMRRLKNKKKKNAQT